MKKSAIGMVAVVFVCGLIAMTPSKASAWNEENVGKILRLPFTPLIIVSDIVFQPARAYCNSKRTGVLRVWDGVKGFATLPENAVERTVRATMDFATFYNDKKWANEVCETGPFTIWAQKSDLGNALKLIGFGTAAGFAASALSDGIILANELVWANPVAMGFTFGYAGMAIGTGADYAIYGK
jgi:hypothetical protein